MNKHHGLIFALLLVLVSGFLFTRYRSQPSLLREKELPPEKFKDSVRRFVTLYNRRHDYAYKFTHPYFELKFTRPAARDVLRDTQFAKAFGTNNPEFHGKALDHARGKIDFLRPFRGETTKYEILSVDEENLTSKLRARIPTRNTSNDELIRRNRTTTIKWFEHEGNYYVYRDLVFNTSGGTIRRKDLVYDTASGPMDHLEKAWGEPIFKKIKNYHPSAHRR